MLSKEASSTIFWVFGMTRPGIEPRSPGPLANTLTARPMSGICVCVCVCVCVFHIIFTSCDSSFKELGGRLPCKIRQRSQENYILSFELLTLLSLFIYLFIYFPALFLMPHNPSQVFFTKDLRRRKVVIMYFMYLCFSLTLLGVTCQIILFVLF